MTNELTGKPVSEEMLNVLERLKQGQDVNKETIDNLKEIKSAYSCILQSTPTNMLKNREEIQSGVLNRLQNMGSAVTKSDGTVSFSGEIQSDRRLDIIIGLPAAGKSSALAEPISELYKSRIIDSDEAKKLLPEYANGWGAGIVHKESQKISDKQFNLAVKKGENIVYPRVGGDCEEMKDYISKAKKQGYKVYVHFNDLDKNKALGRMINRFLETGRFISPDLITKYGNSIENTYQTLRNSNLVDGFSKWSNDVPLGYRPKLIECSASCKDMCISLKPTILERLEKNKEIADQLCGKILEVNEVLKSNPKLSAEYVKTRDDVRQKKAKKKSVGEKKEKKHLPHKPKKPSSPPKRR
ncbi:MAG: zeta toxin family protein [Eubacterium sp.]|nr:zeta toxin family protein [Eubacterium sp.]